MDDDVGWIWPAWKFGMKQGDLFSTLHDRYNTVSSAIQDPEAFHHDVYELSHEASSADDLHRLLADRKEQRLRELNDALQLASIEIIANPSLIGTEQWQIAVQLFRTRSLDSLVRYFSTYLPQDHAWYKSQDGPLSPADSDIGESVLAPPHEPFFPDEGQVAHDPYSYGAGSQPSPIAQPQLASLKLPDNDQLSLDTPEVGCDVHQQPGGDLTLPSPVESDCESEQSEVKSYFTRGTSEFDYCSPSSSVSDLSEFERPCSATNESKMVQQSVKHATNAMIKPSLQNSRSDRDHPAGDFIDPRPSPAPKFQGLLSRGSCGLEIDQDVGHDRQNGLVSLRYRLTRAAVPTASSLPRGSPRVQKTHTTNPTRKLRCRSVQFFKHRSASCHSGTLP